MIEKLTASAGVLRRAARSLGYIWRTSRTKLTDAERDLAMFGDRILHAREPSMGLCDCATKANDRVAAHCDHEPGCKWFTLRCQGCHGTGWCPDCQGDGLNEKGRATLPPDYDPEHRVQQHEDVGCCCEAEGEGDDE